MLQKTNKQPDYALSKLLLCFTFLKTSNGICTMVLGFYIFLCLVLSSLGCVWFFIGNGATKTGVEVIPQVNFEAFKTGANFLSKYKSYHSLSCLTFYNSLIVLFFQFVDDFGHDGSLYIDNTNLEISHLLTTNFDEALDNFETTLNGIIDEFEITVNGIVDEQIAPVIDQFNEDFQPLLNGYSVIIVDMNDFTSQIENFCHNNCPNEVDQILNVLQQVESLPDIDAGELSSVLDDIDSQIKKVIADFRDTYFEDILAETDKVRDFLVTTSNDITAGVTEIKGIIGDLNITPDDVSDVLDNYKYAAIGLEVIGSLVVMILAVLLLALFWGCTGKPGDKKTSTASSVFNATVGVYLVLGVLFFLLTVLFFTVGALLTRYVCETIEEPENSDILDVLSKPLQDELTSIYENIGGENVDLNLTIAGILVGLKAGTPIYPLFQLNQIYDLNELKNDWKSTYNINSYIDIANQSLVDAIDSLQEFSATIDIVEHEIVPAAEMADTILNQVVNEIISFDLGESITWPPALNASLEKIKTDIKTTFASYETEGGTYSITLKSDTVNMTKSFSGILAYFEEEGKVLVVNFFDCSINKILGVIDSYLNYAVDSLETSLAGTAPLGFMIDGFDIGLCRNILDPFNTGWIKNFFYIIDYLVFGFGGILVYFQHPFLSSL